MHNKEKKIAIVSGPTGGHFFPALSIGDSLIEKGIKVKFFVPERGFIINWLNKRNYNFSIIPEVKISKKNVFIVPFKFLYNVLKCFIFIQKENFVAIVGTGSYTTFPFLVAGKILRKDIYLHEQNYIPGKVTKFFSILSRRTFLTFPYRNKLPEKKVVVTGFPLLKEFKIHISKEEIIENFFLDKNKKVIVVFGGSQSASFLNKLITSNIDYFVKKNDFHIIIIAGKEKVKVEEIFFKKKVSGIVFDFYYNMNELYSIADIVISRAGAGTISELTYWKIPSILIPYPFAGGHQFFNAMFLQEKDACFLIPQREEIVYNFPLYFEKFLGNYEKIKKALEKVKIYDDGKIVNIITGALNEKK
ncbi:MAG TPA: glycosyltransferase [Candidatus Ratteibacteria bacterium]|nr:glycosyltransferase [Candidatus Ratteibacteria bacterium]